MSHLLKYPANVTCFYPPIHYSQIWPLKKIEILKFSRFGHKTQFHQFGGAYDCQEAALVNSIFFIVVPLSLTVWPTNLNMWQLYDSQTNYQESCMMLTSSVNGSLVTGQSFVHMTLERFVQFDYNSFCESCLWYSYT